MPRPLPIPSIKLASGGDFMAVGFGAAHHDAVGMISPTNTDSCLSPHRRKPAAKGIHHDQLSEAMIANLQDDAQASGSTVADHRDKYAG